MRDQDVHMLTKLARRLGVAVGSRKTRRCWKWGGGAGDLIKVKVTKGCKHARSTLISTQRGMTGFVETL